MLSVGWGLAAGKTVNPVHDVILWVMGEIKPQVHNDCTVVSKSASGDRYDRRMLDGCMSYDAFFDTI
jgi:hypothetical protein